MSDIGKSLSISWSELACKDDVKTPYPASFICDGRVIELIVMFERIRLYFGGKPIIINSAYRTVSHNKKVGGSPKSMHLEGRALDIQPPEGTTVTAFYNELRHNADWIGIRGLGKYKTFVHVDIRNVKELVTWDLSK